MNLVFQRGLDSKGVGTNGVGTKGMSQASARLSRRASGAHALLDSPEWGFSACWYYLLVLAAGRDLLLEGFLLRPNGDYTLSASALCPLPAAPSRPPPFPCTQLLALPSKREGLFAPEGGTLIARSDTNGEDLEGYAGAGLYDR